MVRSNPLVGKVLAKADHPWSCDTLVRLCSRIPPTNVGAVHRAVCPACSASAPFMTQQPGQERVNRPPCEFQLLVIPEDLVGGCQVRLPCSLEAIRFALEVEDSMLAGR